MRLFQCRNSMPPLSIPLPGLVAIVEDDFQIAHALIEWFSLGGLHSKHYGSSEGLLQAIVQGTELVAAVLDLNLPGKSGFELATTLRKQFPRLPIAIITALTEDERVAYGIAPAGIACLQKPFDLDALDDALFPMMHANLRMQQSRIA